MVEEAIGGNAVEEEAVGGVPLGVGDGADGRGGVWGSAVGKVGIGGGEGGEVVGAEYMAGGLVERVENRVPRDRARRRARESEDRCFRDEVRGSGFVVRGRKRTEGDAVL